MSIDLDDPGDWAEWARIVEAKTEEVKRLLAALSREQAAIEALRKITERQRDALAEAYAVANRRDAACDAAECLGAKSMRADRDHWKARAARLSEALVEACDLADALNAEVHSAYGELNDGAERRIAELRSIVEPARAPAPGDIPRCEKCAWPLSDSREQGCVPGDCSYRGKP